MRGLGKCRCEFSLMTLGYNFKRVMNVLGEAAFAEYCLQKQRLGGEWRVNQTPIPRRLDRDPELNVRRGVSLPILRCCCFPG